jgi:hypothetical protein
MQLHGNCVHLEVWNSKQSGNCEKVMTITMKEKSIQKKNATWLVVVELVHWTQLGGLHAKMQI